MSKKDKSDEEPDKDWRYDGAASKWDRFDSKVGRHARKRLSTLGDAFWKGFLPDLDDLDEASPEFAAHCEEAWDVIEERDSARATRLYPSSSGFWTIKFQVKWRAREYQLLYDFVEARCEGTAEEEMKSYSVNDHERLRAKLFKQFGAGMEEDVHERERHYDAGMPDKGKLAFTPGMDMRIKLRMMTNEKHYFWEMCKPKNRAKYAHCQDKKLVRIILDHINDEHAEDIARVLSTGGLARQIEALKGGNGHEEVASDGDESDASDASKYSTKSDYDLDDVDFSDVKAPGDEPSEALSKKIASKRKVFKVKSKVVKKVKFAKKKKKGLNEVATSYDEHDRTFSDDWLPTLGTLKHTLINACVRKTKAKSKNFQNGGGVPTMMGLSGDGSLPTCYGCGETGHRRGASECSAGKDAVWSGAPQRFKDRFNGSSQGGKQSKDMSSRPCFAFDGGKGHCRFGAACKYSHSKTGGGNASAKTGNDKFGKSQKRSIKAMVATELGSVIKNAVKKSKKSKKNGRKRKAETSDSEDGEDNLSTLIANVMNPNLCLPFTIPRERYPAEQLKLPAMAAQLHDVKKNAGWDTCAGRTISCSRGDFLWIDDSEEALASIGAPMGINGGGSRPVAGIGPFAKRLADGALYIDPSAVYLKPQNGCPIFCVIGAQRAPKLGVRTVQRFEDSEVDVIQCIKTKEIVHLDEENGILVLPITGDASTIRVTPEIRGLVEDIRTGHRPALVTMAALQAEECATKRQMEAHGNGLSAFMTVMLMATVVAAVCAPAMVFNEAKMGKKARSRLYVKRFGDCDSNLFPKMKGRPDVYGDVPDLQGLNEDNGTQDDAKWSRGAYPANTEQAAVAKDPWEIVFCDGAGGQRSMGVESMEGAVGEYMFVCSGTGSKKIKLHASHEQFPMLLYHFLSQVEADHFRCRKIFVDTFSVNLSQEAHEVAAQFHCVIVPISAGTPQELAFAESAHRVIAGIARAMILNAPHMPKNCWSLADMYGVWVNDFLPQRLRDFLSPYFLRTGKVIDWRRICLHVWGCPVKFSGMNGPAHKRTSKMEDGWFAGVQWPMVLILRKSDMKIISVSSKKVKHYESMYAAPLDEKVPNCAEITESIELSELKWLELEGEEYRGTRIFEDEVHEGPAEKSPPKPALPKHVLSVKSLSEFKTASGAGVSDGPASGLETSASTYGNDPGEGLYVPEHVTYDKDRLVSDLKKMQARVAAEVSEPDLRNKVIKVLKNGSDLINSKTRAVGALKKGKKQKPGSINAQNIIGSKRVRFKSETNKGTSTKKKKAKKGLAKSKAQIANAYEVGDLVSVSSTVFDGATPGSYSAGMPERCYGTVVGKDPKSSKRCTVHFVEDDSSWCPLFSEMRMEKKKLSTNVMLACMLIEGTEARYDAADKAHWPKNFFEALCKSDWRSWIAAVKKEINSWHANDTYKLIDIKDKTAGASIVPLGELYTRKRDDESYKYRQYMMGNLLKEGQDFRDTFSTTVTWDGIRWCSSMACGCNKKVYGWDAITGYLQAKEHFDIYAFMPSHELYNDLSYEELAVFRTELLELVSREGPEGLRKFAAKHKRDSRINPKQCLKIERSVYGNPGAGNSFEMLVRGSHLKGAKMTQSDVEPSIYMRIQVDANDVVTDYVVAHTHVDDCSYFGTDRLRKEYEDQIAQHLKVKFGGEAKRFVGTETVQDLERGLFELKLPEYWTRAAKVFEKHFPNGCKVRATPIAVADERLLCVEVSDEEHQAAKHLPYRELLGTISYPAACVKLEMRYCVSILGRYRGKWGLAQWKVLCKAFEHGYYTRELGLIYSRGLDCHGVNRLYAYADSSHNVPRSQGCEEVLMNGACIALDTKKHTITGASTCHDELMSFSKATNKVEGFRNLMQEAGEYQEEPTVIYQDNQAAIQIAMNRGSLSSRSKHMDLKVLQARNKIEDRKCVPKYKHTSRLAADIGTKALPEATFCLLRDINNGHGLVKRHFPDREVPEMVVDPWK